MKTTLPFKMSLSFYIFLFTLLVLPTHADTKTVETLTTKRRYHESLRRELGSYFIEFHGDPGTPLSRQSIHSFYQSAKVSNIKFRTRNTYSRLFNGVAIDLPNSQDLSEISSLPYVKRAWPIQMRSRSAGIPSNNASPNLMFAHEHTGVSKAHEVLGLDGAGVKVGVIDTGVDYMHPDLGGCWRTTGCRFQYGYDFVGNRYDSVMTPRPMPGPDPRDTCDGHGTHVAGIIAANGSRVRGVAPAVTLGVYRIFGCPGNGTGQAADDVILKAMEAAHEDKMDVINMSFGGGSGWGEDPLSVAASRLVQDGIVVVASTGNDGANGLYTSGSPGLGPGVINVASFDNWMITSLSIDINGPTDKASIVHSSPGNSKIGFFFKQTEIAAPLDSTGSNEGCHPLVGNYTEKLVLLKRGNCTFVEKAVNAQNAGAVGVIVYNYEAELMSPTSVSPDVKIPLVVIKPEDAEFITSQLSHGTVNITAGNNTVSKNNPMGGQISRFSSWGPDPELKLSPAIGAPGGNIFSTFPLDLGGYTSLSGTSMSSPYVAGMAALIVQARNKKISVQEMRQLILQNARPIIDKNTTLPLSPLRQGAGLVNIYKSLLAKASILPSQISINNTDGISIGDRSVANSGLDQVINEEPWAPTLRRRQGRPMSRLPGASGSWPRESIKSLKIFNHDETSYMSYTMTNIPATSVSSFLANSSFTAEPRTWPENNHTKYSMNTLPGANIVTPSVAVKIAPGMSQKIQVRITAPTGLKASDKWFYGGYLKFNLSWDDANKTTQTLHVPYVGFHGDYSKLDILSPPEEGFPYISMKGSTSPLEKDARVDIDSSHRLSLHYRLEHPTRLLKLQLIDSQNTSRGYLPYGYIEYMGRNYQSSRGKYFNATINGTVYEDPDLAHQTTVEPGEYRVKLDALRPLHDPEDPEGFQTWVSPQFIINSVTFTSSQAVSENNIDGIDMFD